MQYLFLLNPAAGREDRTGPLTEGIRAALDRAGVAQEDWEICLTRYKGHAQELAEAAAQKAQASGQPVEIFAAGGDGTFHEALAGAWQYPLAAVGCLPIGSGNDFLRSFGTREEFLDLDGQLAGGIVPIDLMDTSLGISGAVCAAGLDAQVAAGAAAYRHNPLFHGEAAYLLSAVRQICGPLGRRFAFEADGDTFETDAMMCAVCNTGYYGGGFQAAPLARADDGWLELVVVKKVSRLKILRLLGRYKAGRHFEGEAIARDLDPYFLYRRVKSVTLAFPDGPVIATADGECAPVDRLTVSVLPKAGRVVLPGKVLKRFEGRRLSAGK